MAKKEIDNFPDYEISDSGEVFSNKVGRGASGISYKLTPQRGTKGYLQVRIGGNEGWKTLKVHRLVAETFIPNPNNLPQVNHIDGNKTNNCISNLEWCTNQENTSLALAKTYKLTKSDGSSDLVYNLNSWCRDHGLHPSCFHKVMNGERSRYRNWVGVDIYAS